MASADSGQRPGGVGRVLEVGAGLALLALALHRVLPSFQGWYHEDDLHNLRWVMEYRDTPWVALTERHTLHDHIRPLTLMTLWVGGFLSNGAYWGQHALLVALDLLGLLALGVLASELAGGEGPPRPRAGLLAVAFAMAVPGFGRMADWNAWMCSAGEIAAGLWGLVFARRALRGGPWWPAALCMVAAGLYKEPGWILYPAGALTLAWSARKTSGRRAVGAVALLAIGVAGFAWSWHPVNLARMEGIGLPWPLRAMRALASDPRGLLDGWPRWEGAPGLVGPGLSVPLLSAVLARMILGPRLGWPAAVVTAGLLLALPSIAGPVLIGAMVLALAVRVEDPPVGLVLSLLTLGIMAPFDKTNEVQVALAGYGLALTMGVEVYSDWTRTPTDRASRAGLAALVGLALGHLLVVSARPVPTATYQSERAMKVRMEAAGALAQTLHAADAWLVGTAPAELEILPLVGLSVRGGTPPEDAVVVGDVLAVHPEAGSVARVLQENYLPRGPILPLVAGGSGGQEVSVIPGWYTLGWMAQAASEGTLQASDACGHVWTARSPSALHARFTPIALEEGCAPLRVGWLGAAGDDTVRPVLAPLDPPRVSLWGPEQVERVLRVGPQDPQQDHRERRAPDEDRRPAPP